MRKFSWQERNGILNRLSRQTYDVIIIGGGITGVGIALDAASRGLTVLAVDMQDFGAGTSSRSTKLVHGGLRYLKQLEVKMVADVGKERATVYENAPHATHPEWMLLPFYRSGTFGKYSTSLGLRVYDWLAGVKRTERRKMLSKQQVLKQEPLLNGNGLIGGGEYVEYRTDDARLTIEVAKKAAECGAHLTNYTKVSGFFYQDGAVKGVRLADQLTGEEYRAFGRVVINAAGPWVENVVGLDEPIPGKHLQLTKGVHLVFDHSRLPLRQPIYFDTPDGRMMFAIPRNDKTYVGTTDTVFEENLVHPSVNQDDIEYIVKAIRSMFPQAGIGPGDIESTWAGVRPLIWQEGKGPSELSRKDEIWESSTGLLTIAGGKLTGYRKMAETVTDKIADRLKAQGIAAGPCRTKTLRLSGGEFKRSSDYEPFVENRARELTKLGLTFQDGLNIASQYGTNTDTIVDLIGCVQHDEELPLSIRLTLQYAIDFEMAVTPNDYFTRRTGAMFFHLDWVRQWKQAVIGYMANEFSWTAEQRERMSRDVEETIELAAAQNVH